MTDSVPVVLAKREAARVLEVGPAAVQWLARQGQLERVERDGSVRYVIDPRRLRKPEHRRRFLAWQVRQQVAASPGPATSEAWASASAAERERALNRKSLLESWEAHLVRASATTRRAVRLATVAFLKEQRTAGVRLSKSTLYAWRCAYREKGIEGLLDRHERPATTIPADALATFNGLYLTQSRRTVAWCYAQLREIYEHPDALPSLGAFYRSVRLLPLAERILARQGEKAYTDQAAPFIERDYTTIAPNDWWVFDHHQVDAACSGRDGKPCFPWLTAIQDVRSRRWVGWWLSDLPPDQHAILAAFARAVKKYGVPDRALLDNGRDFRSRPFSGGRPKSSRLELDETRVRSVLAHLDVEPHFAIPYNARSKPIERAFRTFKEWFSREWESYRGGNPSERPELMRVLFRELRNLATLAQMDAVLGQWIERLYNEHPHAGQAMDGRSPREVYDALLTERRVVPDKRALDLLLMPTSRPLKVGRNGVKIEALGLTYWSEALHAHLGKEVVVRYDLDDIGEVAIFSMKEEFLCHARAVDKLAWGQSHDVARERLAEQRRMKRVTKANVAAKTERSREPNAFQRVLARRETPPKSPRPPKVTKLHRTLLEPEAAKMANAREAAAERRAARPRDAEILTAMRANAPERPLTREELRAQQHDFARRMGYDI